MTSKPENLNGIDKNKPVKRSSSAGKKDPKKANRGLFFSGGYRGAQSCAVQARKYEEKRHDHGRGPGGGAGRLGM